MNLHISCTVVGRHIKALLIVREGDSSVSGVDESQSGSNHEGWRNEHLVIFTRIGVAVAVVLCNHLRPSENICS